MGSEGGDRRRSRRKPSAAKAARGVDAGSLAPLVEAIADAERRIARAELRGRPSRDGSRADGSLRALHDSIDELSSLVSSLESERRELWRRLERLEAAYRSATGREPYRAAGGASRRSGWRRRRRGSSGR